MVRSLRLLAVFALVLTSCVQPADESSSTTVGTDLVGGFPAHVQCMLDNGFHLVGVDEPKHGTAQLVMSLSRHFPGQSS